MKKGATPELDQKWWSKNKAKTMKKSGLGDALKDYEIAKDSLDYSDMLAKLALVKKKALFAKKSCCNKKLHSETVAALGKYDGVIKKEEKWITTNQKAYEEQFAKAVSGEIPMQKIGKDVVIWKRDIGVEVLKEIKPSNLDIEFKAPMELKLNDDILDVLEKEKDKVSPGLMGEEAEKRSKALVKSIVELLKKIDTALPSKSPQDQDKLLAAAEKSIEKQLDDEVKLIEKIPNALWADFLKRKKQYKNYRIKAGTDLAIQTLKVAGGAVATGAAGAGTFGAGAIIGVVALARDCATMAKQVYNLAIEAETVQKALKGDIDSLTSYYLNAKGEASKKMNAQEITGTVLKSILSVDAPFLATLPKCNSNLDLFDNKVAGLEVNGRKLSAELVNALSATADAEKEMSGLEGKRARKAFAQLKGTRKALHKSLDACGDMMARAKKTKPAISGMKTAIKKLDDENPSFNKIFEKALPMLTNLALAGASAGVGFVDAKTALDTANTALGLANGVLSEVKAGIEIKDS